MWKSETRGAQTWHRRGGSLLLLLILVGMVSIQQLEAQMMILAAFSPFFCFWRPGKNDQLAQIGEKGGKVIWAMQERNCLAGRCSLIIWYNIHITFHRNFQVLDVSRLCLVPRVSSKNLHILESNSLWVFHIGSLFPVDENSVPRMYIVSEIYIFSKPPFLPSFLLLWDDSTIYLGEI